MKLTNVSRPDLLGPKQPDEIISTSDCDAVEREKQGADCGPRLLKVFELRSAAAGVSEGSSLRRRAKSVSGSDGVQHRAWEKTSKIDDAEPGGMRNGVCAADRVEFVEQRADMELGGVDRNAKPLGDHLV